MTNATRGFTTGRLRGMILGGLVTTGLAVGIFGPSVASASTAAASTTAARVGTQAPDQVQAKGWNSSAFRVVNGSPFTLRQTSATTEYKWQCPNTPPPNGATIKPGDRVHYEAETPLRWLGILRTIHSVISYDAIDSDGRIVGSISAKLAVATFDGSATMTWSTMTGLPCKTNGWDTITLTWRASGADTMR